MQTVTNLTLRSFADDAFVKVSSLSKNLQFLRISGNQTITTGRDSWIKTVHLTGQGPTESITIGIAFEESCGFPQLKTLHFNGEFFEDDNSFNAFKYFCEKSPMLEEIYLYGSLGGHENLFHTVYDNLCKSIGSLLNRPALRTLHINIFQPCPMRCFTEIFNKSITNMIEFPVEKPKLERLRISLMITLSDKMKPQISTHDLGQLKIYLVRDMLLRQDFREKVQSY